jgi:hypothetical protein
MNDDDERLPWVIILKISKNYYKEIKYFNRGKIIAFRKDICTQMKDHRILQWQYNIIDYFLPCMFNFLIKNI